MTLRQIPSQVHRFSRKSGVTERNDDEYHLATVMDNGRAALLVTQPRNGHYSPPTRSKAKNAPALSGIIVLSDRVKTLEKIVTGRDMILVLLL